MHEKIVLGNALEGESHVGKSTTIEVIKNIEQIREKGIIVVPEYSVIGSLPEFPRKMVGSIKKSIQHIIDLEKRRTDGLSAELAKHPQSSVVFDRGPISCIAFEHAAEKNGYMGAALWIAEAFQKEVENKNIIVPQGMIHLTADGNIIRERERADLRAGHSKIMDFLQDQEVIKTLNEAFDAFGKLLPKQLFLSLNTNNKNPNEIGAEILQFIKEQPKNVLDELPNFIKYANLLAQGKNT